MENLEFLKQEEKLDIQLYLFKVLRFWPFLLITLLISLTGAYFYNKYTPSVYSGQTSVMIFESDNTYRSNRGPANIMEGFGMFSKKINIENEIGILQSLTLSKNVMVDQKPYCTIYQKGFLSNTEFYHPKPFEVIFDTSKLQSLFVEFEVEILSTSNFRLKSIMENPRQYNYLIHKKISKAGKIQIDGVYDFDKSIENDYFSFALHKDSLHTEKYVGQSFFFKFNDPHTLAQEMKSKLNISPLSEESSILSISITGSSPYKIADLLNSLIKVYMDKNLERKNKIAQNTIFFINEQLENITDSLHFTEKRLQDFRTSNDIMDLSYQAQLLLQKMQELDRTRSEWKLKIEYFNYLKNYLSQGKGFSEMVVPSTVGIQDDLLNELCSELIKLYLEKNALANSDKQKNPYINSLNQKIESTKRSVVENLRNTQNSAEISLKDIEMRIKLLENEIDKLPRKERELFGIERQFKINDAIYTFLLQKRAEAQIAKASNLPDYEIVEPADAANCYTISPRTKVNYLMAFLLGLALPIFFIISYYVFNDKISEKSDIEKISKAPIVGYIQNNHGDTLCVVSEKPKSPIAESFRSLRTNLDFFFQGEQQKTFLITSSIGSEGKTFNSVNLAAGYRLMGKKVIILGFDLRKPSLAKNTNLSLEIGISNYLSSEVDLEDQIQKFKTNEIEFDILGSGPVPPNPVEMIASAKTKQMFEYLKSIYNVIIIDSPPIGVVTDANLLMNYADLCIYIVRQRFTPKKVFASIIKDLSENPNLRIAFLINDLEFGTSRYSYGYGYRYGYGYGYRYGYGYGYDSDEKNKRKWSILYAFKRIRRKLKRK